MTQSTLHQDAIKNKLYRPRWSNYEKDRLLSGLFATDVDAVSIDVSTYFRLLHDNLFILCTFYFTNPIAQSWWRTKWRPTSVIRLGTGHVR